MIAIICFIYGPIEGLSYHLQGFTRSPFVVAAMVATCGIIFLILRFFNQSCQDTKPGGFLQRHPRLRPIFERVKDQTSPVTTITIAVVVTEKLLYKFP
jgi:hypothetical protein